ncbi:MAG: DNA polymerase III subunit delta [Clostridia bacterium]|nr:DNA polymerase III subunit delta [Clostridia bacterium]
MTVENLEKELKQQKLNNIYLFYGEETYLLDSAVKKIKKIFGELLLGINYIQINETNIQNLISDIETPAFSFDKKLIIVKNAKLLKKESKSNKKNNNELQQKIAKYIEDNINTIKNTTVIVFIEEDISKCDLVKVIEQNGVICNFEKLKPIEIKKRIKNICNMYKTNIGEQELQLFIETCGTDMQNLINEIRKLIEYASQDGIITIEMINKLSTKQFEAKIFDLTDNLGKKNIAKALEILKELLYNKEPIQKILITLYNHFKKLYLIKLCLEYNRDILDVLKLKSNQTFLVSKYKKQAEYFKTKELRKILEELINLDRNYKIGLIDINIGLEAILCTYLG